MCVDSCRIKSFGKTPHIRVERGLAASGEGEVHFRSDICTHDFEDNHQLFGSVETVYDKGPIFYSEVCT